MNESGEKTGTAAPDGNLDNPSSIPASEIGEHARLYRLLADNAREMVSRHTADLTFLYASPAASRVIGYPPDHLIGQRLDDLAHPDDLSSVLSTFALARDTREDSSTVFRCRSPDQRWRWCEVMCRGVFDEATGTE